MSVASSGRSAVRSRRPQPPLSPPGLTVAPTHSSRPPRPAHDRRSRRPDRFRGPKTPTVALSSCRRPDLPPRPRRAAPRPPRRARRFTPPHAARASASLPRSAPRAEKLLQPRSPPPAPVPLPPPCAGTPFARRAPASSGCVAEALELALPGERLLTRPETGCSSVLSDDGMHPSSPSLSALARVSSVSRYAW